MLLKEHINLITALIEKTNSGSIKWAKAELQFAYSSTINNNKILLDRYYAAENGETVSCLNLSIFNNDKLCEEIVLCKAIEAQKPDYDLLDTLYKKVEELNSIKVTESKIPLLASITQSVQSL